MELLHTLNSTLYPKDTHAVTDLERALQTAAPDSSALDPLYTDVRPLLALMGVRVRTPGSEPVVEGVAPPTEPYVRFRTVRTSADKAQQSLFDARVQRIVAAAAMGSSGSVSHNQAPGSAVAAAPAAGWTVEAVSRCGVWRIVDLQGWDQWSRGGRLGSDGGIADRSPIERYTKLWQSTLVSDGEAEVFTVLSAAGGTV